MKIKENVKRDKYLDLARELKKAMEHEDDMTPIVIGDLGTIPRSLVEGGEELEIRVETIQLTALLRSARILRRVLDTWGDLLLLKLQGKTIS